jgi:hypothetical protein
MEDAIGGECGTCERQESLGGGSLKERDHLEEMDVNGRIRLIWVLTKQDEKFWA